MHPWHAKMLSMKHLFSRIVSRLNGAVLCSMALLATSASAGSGAKASTDPKDAEADAQVDFLGLAARMLHDQHTDRALKVLRETDPQDPTLDKGRFYTLRGLAHLKLKEHAAARSDFESAIKHGQQAKLVSLQLAQACFSLEAHACTLSALKQAGPTSNDDPAVALMKAQTEWKLDMKDSALRTLQTGQQRFPDRAEFQKLRLFYLLELQLYSEAAAVSEQYLNQDKLGAQEFVAVGEALRAAGQFKRAQLVMEQARLRYPQDEQVQLQLAHAYLDDGQLITSAMLFEQAARHNRKYTLEAAELYKQAGMLHRATWLNAQVSDQAAKAKQRLSLLVEGQDYDAVTALLPKLSRLGLLTDENIRYAVAYAYYKTNQFTEAEAHLKFIRDPQLFEAAMQLRKAMQSCLESGWECSL